MSDDKNDDDFDFSSAGKDGEFENIDDLEELDDLDDFGDLDDIEVIEEGDPEPLVQADKTARKEELHADSVDEDGFASDSLEDDLDDGGMYDVDGEGWDDEESDVMAQAQGAPKKKKSSLVMVLGILVLVGGAGAAYYFTQMAPADKPTPRTPTQTQMDPAAQDQAAVQERPSGFLNDPDLLEDDELNSDIALSREDTGAVPQPLPQPQPSVGIPDQLRGDRFNPNDTDEGGLPQPQPVNNNNGVSTQTKEAGLPRAEDTSISGQSREVVSDPSGRETSEIELAETSSLPKTAPSLPQPNKPSTGGANKAGSQDKSGENTDVYMEKPVLDPSAENASDSNTLSSENAPSKADSLGKAPARSAVSGSQIDDGRLTRLEKDMTTLKSRSAAMEDHMEMLVKEFGTLKNAVTSAGPRMLQNDSNTGTGNPAGVQANTQQLAEVKGTVERMESRMSRLENKIDSLSLVHTQPGNDSQRGKGESSGRTASGRDDSSVKTTLLPGGVSQRSPSAAGDEKKTAPRGKLTEPAKATKSESASATYIRIDNPPRPMPKPEEIVLAGSGAKTKSGQKRASTLARPVSGSTSQAGRGGFYAAPGGQGNATNSASSTQDFSGAADVRWILRAAQPDRAWLSPQSEPNLLKEVVVGDRVLGLGRIVSIETSGGQWVVRGTEGRAAPQ